MPADELTLHAARRLANYLIAAKIRIVLAESCTAGNVAGTLALTPGISASLCGCFVIYRNDSKMQWLGVPKSLIDDPQIGPVSAQVTAYLADRALRATPEAAVGIAVTGHLGPGSPVGLDGRLFLAVTQRGNAAVIERTRQLTIGPADGSSDLEMRQSRMTQCTQWVLNETLQVLTTAFPETCESETDGSQPAQDGERRATKN